MQKILIELNYDQVEEIILNELKRQLDYTTRSSFTVTPDDIKYNKKLKKALEFLIDYYSA